MEGARLTRLAGRSFAGSVATQLIGAASGIVAARLLGPEGKGLVVAIVLWPGLLAALGGGLGLEDAVAYFAAREPGRSGALVSTAAAIAVGQAAVLSAAGWLLVPPLLPAMPASAQTDARLYLAWIGISYLTLTAVAGLQGSLRFGALNLLRPAVVTFVLLGLAALAAARAVSVHAVVVVYLVANALAMLASWRTLLAGRRPSVPDGRLLGPLIRFALKAQTGHVAAVANDRVDLALLSMLLPSAQLGLYAAALSLSAVVRLFGSSLSLVALPALAANRDATAMARDLGRLTRATVYSSLLAAIAVAGLASPAIKLLFGSAFGEAAAAAQVLALATVGLNASRVLGAGLKAAGMPAAAGFGEALGAAATVGLMLALIPRVGLLGAAIAALASYLVSAGCAGWIACRRLAISPAALLLPAPGDLAWLAASRRAAVA